MPTIGPEQPAERPETRDVIAGIEIDLDEKGQGASCPLRISYTRTIRVAANMARSSHAARPPPYQWKNFNSASPAPGCRLWSHPLHVSVSAISPLEHSRSNCWVHV